MYRAVYYGDSIPSGTGATSPIAQGLHAGLSDFFPGEIFYECGGSRRAYDDWSTSTARTAFAQRVARARAQLFITSIGVNDWGTNPQTVANFQTMYQNAITAIYNACPGIRLVCITPFLTTEEAVTNGEPKTIPNYRTAVVNACTATGYAASQLLVINGDTDLGLVSGDISGDNLHPLTRGHGTIATKLLQLMGYAF